MPVSVVIRARDEAGAIGRTLDLLAAQTLAHEVIVVDSGSTDATAAIAAARGARVVEIAPERFTFGRALNLGTGESGGDIVVALSAHAFPRSDAWLARMAAWFDDAEVACAFGETVDPGFRPLTGPVRQDAATLAAQPYWGYSNGAGAFRRSLWEERPFREDLPGSEDREWSRWALSRGLVCVLDPALAVDHDHSRDGIRTAFTRYAREARGFALYLDLPGLPTSRAGTRVVERPGRPPLTRPRPPRPPPRSPPRGQVVGPPNPPPGRQCLALFRTMQRRGQTPRFALFRTMQSGVGPVLCVVRNNPCVRVLIDTSYAERGPSGTQVYLERLIPELEAARRDGDPRRPARPRARRRRAAVVRERGGRAGVDAGRAAAAGARAPGLTCCTTRCRRSPPGRGRRRW